MVAQAQITFTTNNGTLIITHYMGPGGTVVIPSSTNGYPVTSIGNGVFQSTSSVTSITIPDSIASIGAQAFRRCFGLTAIMIPEGVTSIGSVACSECINLTGVSIPGSVTNIGNNAFAVCDSLNAITVISHSTVAPVWQGSIHRASFVPPSRASLGSSLAPCLP
jgi:hypothetical protein